MYSAHRSYVLILLLSCTGFLFTFSSVYTAVASTRPVLGKAYDISNIKKRIGPLVTAKTTKQLNRKISSRSAIIVDAVSGKTLYARNPDTQRQPASTIKVITGMIALKSLSGTEKIPEIGRASCRERVSAPV